MSTPVDQEPQGLLTIRTIAMPADLNFEGDVFGGWLMAQMDMAGGIAARWRCGGRVATVAVDAMTFHLPMKVGDELSCYCICTKIGRTSITYRVEVLGAPPRGRGAGEDHRRHLYLRAGR